MSTLFLSLIIIAICIILLSFNIIFRKQGKFPDTEIGHNKQMKKLGISCAKSQERALWNKDKCSRDGCCCNN